MYTSELGLLNSVNNTTATNKVPMFFPNNCKQISFDNTYEYDPSVAH